MADLPLSNGSGGSNAKLAMMLRECADLIERNELNPLVYQAWGALNVYVKEHGATTRVTTTTTTHVPPPPTVSRESRSRSPETRKPSVVPDDLFSPEASAGFEDGNDGAIPFDESPSRPVRSQTTPTTETTTRNATTSEGSLGHKSKDPFGFGNVAKKLGKLGLGPPPKPSTDSQKSATSKKNADRVKADLAAEAGSDSSSKHHRKGGGYGREDEFCEEHFTMGCACKAHHIHVSGNVRSISEEAEISSAAASTTSKPEPIKTVPSNASSTASATSPNETTTVKPAFHRPSKPNSTLIANGWIEQQRRSRMRSAWKEVLASLVEGRTPQEETTLWIQRQITTSNGKPQLQALHQIPMKWLESVNYLEFYTDNRFTIKVYNVPDEFQFRCADADSAQNWVLTLRSVSEIVKQKGGSAQDLNPKDVGIHNLDDWDGASNVSGQTESSSHRMTIKELQAIAHGAGLNTSGMERAELERLVTEIALRRRNPQKEVEERRRQLEEEQRRREEEHLRRQQEAEQLRRQQEVTVEVPPQPRRGVAELRSIAHGAGYNTSGMERAELERLVAKISADEANLQQQKDAALEAQRRRQELAEAEQRRRQQETEAEQIRRQKEAEAEQRRRQQEAEAEQIRRQQEAEAEQRRRLEEEKRRAAELEQRRRQHEEEQRRLTEAEQLRRQQEEEERRRRLAEQQAAEQRKKQEEEQRRKWQQQQAAAEEHRRRLTEQQAAEQRKKQEWERAQWQAQQAAQAAAQRAEWEKNWHAQQRQQQQQQQQYPQQQAGYPGQQQAPPQQPPPRSAPPPQGYRPPPPQQAGYQPPPNNQGYRPPPPPPQPQQQQQHPASPADLKYAKMADQSDSGQAAITAIKRNILINWALQPPTLQMLRPIDVLLTTIHNVFPPAFGVKGHDYFTKWTPIARESIVTGAAMGNAPDDAKLKKAVRKLRFFLHPDKLPRDLDEEQSFMCKMLWDVTSDAWEEFHKKNEELGWIHN